ncbi:MAG TPA: SDR family NAD(P)-dependent oxidoreductase [Pseudonocardiaceae bacterium]|jgi:NADP-dependent 3-hydroxy acid dehydrogenase YdfG|nr:SDR family NAD(P)-dependent oxidoreductase [Pseudonocardiaceae bacterium]
MRTIAIFGAGPALGLAVARRFGREGFRVALVARDQGRLDDMVGMLAGEGVEAAGFQADLTDRAAALNAADAIEARFGSINVLEYSPAGDASIMKSPSEIDVATVTPLLDKFLLTPVALVRRVLPGMLERGDGGLLFALGAAAKYPMPHLASAGIVVAGLRNYVHTLHAELGPKNVYAGALLIGALIEGSEAHRNASAWGGEQRLAVVSAEDLAQRYWDLYVKRDHVEDEVASDHT